MSIHVLPPEVVSRIAAGEVVERPASVVKELVENSLDAGATHIRVEAWGGGVRLIRVGDNGWGIPEPEVALAFQGHATSKISQFSDMESLSTLGFRGEALASIAAVAEVEILTRTAGELAGTYLRLRHGSIGERGHRGCPQGTIVTVHVLFRNLPARLKFLKSQATENSHIIDFVTRYGLAYPEVSFELHVDGREAISTPGKGGMREAAGSLYGWEVAGKLLEVQTGEGGKGPIKVKGLVAPPELARSSRNYLSFFVNRRWVQSALLTRAVEEAYQEFLMRGRYPLAVLVVTLSPQECDVNVHPTKREVRFRDSQGVFSAVYKAVRDALEKTPSSRGVAIPTTAVPVASSSPEQMTMIRSEAERAEVKGAVALSSSQAKSPVPILRVVGQLANTYIVAEGPDGLYLVDQHAAHERVLYQKTLAMAERRESEVQGLLEPLLVELAPRQAMLLAERKEIAAEFGFSLEPFGERAYLVRAIPAALKGQDVSGGVVEVLDALAEGKTVEEWREGLAISIACHGAVRAGQVLSHEEMRELVRQLEHTSQPRTCPHGRPTMVHLSSGLLEREFGRR